MESEKVKDPKDEKILNKDDSVTNKDEDKERPISQDKPEKEKVLTLISDNDIPGELADESASNKGQGPAGENL